MLMWETNDPRPLSHCTVNLGTPWRLSCEIQASENRHRCLTQRTSGEPLLRDPAAAADTFSIQVLQDRYEGLTAESPTGSAVTAGASHPEVEVRAPSKPSTSARRACRTGNQSAPRTSGGLAPGARPQTGIPVADDLRLMRVTAPSLTVSGAWKL